MSKRECITLGPEEVTATKMELLYQFFDMEQSSSEGQRWLVVCTSYSASKTQAGW